MKIIRDSAQKLNKKAVVALGCFDGVHIAHARVIGEAVRIARERELASVVWSFREPPKNSFSKEKVPLICDSTEKARLIQALGADVLTEPDFTAEIAGISARDFVEKLLVDCAGAVHLVCGRSYTFGAFAKGNVDVLGELCREFGLGLSIVDDVTADGVPVSSTLVRDAVAEGRCMYASSLLGRSFALCFDGAGGGFDISGDGGTAFKINEKYLCAPEGEYGVTVYFDGHKKECVAFVREGKEGRELILNTHIDTSSRVRVEFCTDRVY